MLSKMPAHRQNDLPFHCGPLRLSVFRESPSIPSKTYEAAEKYDAVFQSFVKRRPLSESFAIAAYDLSSSSSDEDISDPVPESPLNLSDTENMASGFNSPSLFGRRRHKVFTNAQDTRPTSLYDAAKPRPPSKEKQQRGEKSSTTTMSEKLNRLIQRRPWRTQLNEPINPEESSYERSFEPIPPNRWTNIIGNTETQKLQPHPPATSPANPAPVRRKKRHAPKPPTNVPPYCVKDETPVLNTEQKKGDEVSSIESPVSPSFLSEQSSMPQSSVPSYHAQDTPPSPTPPIPPQRNLKKSKPKSAANEAPNVDPKDRMTVPIIDSEVDPLSDSTKQLQVEEPQKLNTIEPAICLPATNTIAVVAPVAAAEATPVLSSEMESSALDTNTCDQSRELQASTVCGPMTTTNKSLNAPADSESAISLKDSLPGEVMVDTGIPDSELKLNSSRTCNREPAVKIFTESNTSVDYYNKVVRFVVDDLLNAVEASMIDKIPENPTKTENSGIPAKNGEESLASDEQSYRSENKAVGSNDVLPSVFDTNDVTTKGKLNISGNPGSEGGKDRHETEPHRKSVDNASSGYSSPGSGDECPVSPETPLSPLALPSPTSSYYSTSLSASSSRVSNLSRELALAKQSPRPSDEMGIANKTIQPQSGCARPLVEETATDELAVEKDPVSNDENPIKPVNIDSNSPDGSDLTGIAAKQDRNATKSAFETSSVETRRDHTQLNFEALPDMPVKLRKKPSATRIRAKSEYIPYSSKKEWSESSNRVTICMIEKPGETASLSRAQARLFKPQHQIKGNKKKALAAQKSRAFAMRAKPRWNHRHSYAEPSGYILDEVESEIGGTSSNLVSHFVSTQNISTYYDGKEQKTITPQEILTSKREEFFNAFKNTTLGRNSEHFGGSVRQLPVSAKEFGYIHSIQEVTEVDAPVRPEDPIVPKTDEVQEALKDSKSSDIDKENVFQRQPSETGSTSSSSHHHSNSSVFTGSTWSLSTDMTSQTRQRKPSLRKRLQGAFSFQNIRKAISMEKLSEEEKRSRSMSHHYLGENDQRYRDGRQRSATLQEKSSNYNDFEQPSNLRKAPSISSIISSVRMRKRKSRNRADLANRYTIGDPESFVKNVENAPESKRSTLRPMSMVLSNANRKRPEDVGSPSFFRPIGRVLQMNPAEGTLLVEMVKPPSGPFGFYIARKKDSGDSGSVYISRLSDSYPDKMFAGLMRTGDEITEVNGTDVSRLTLDQVYDLILDSERTLLKIRPSQVHVV